MTNDQKILVELELCNALRTFHDLPDKEKREVMSKQYFFEFCEKNGIDSREAFEITEEILKEKSKLSHSDYSDSIEALHKDIDERE